MKENINIQDLFEQAKNEPPKLTFEEAAERFQASLPPASPIDILKDFLTYNLNTIMIISTSSIVLSTLLFLVLPNWTTDTTQPISENVHTTLSEEGIENLESDLFQNELITENFNGSSEPSSNEKGKEETSPRSLPTIEKNTITVSENETTFKEGIDFIQNNASHTSRQTTIDDFNSKSIAPPPLLLSPVHFEPLTVENSQNDFTDWSLLPIFNDTFPTLEKTANEPLNHALEGKVKRKSIDVDDNSNRKPYRFSSSINKGKYGKWQTYTKSFEKELDISPNGLTSIISECGNIKIKTWNQNKTKFEVLVTLDTDRPKKAEEVLNNIEIDFSKTNKGVKAETIIQKRKAIKWNNRRNWEVSVDYIVYVPVTSSLEINHHTGDIFVEAIKGSGDFDLLFGNLDVKGMGDNSKIVLRNSNGQLGKSGDLYASLHFAEIIAEEVGNLELKAINSTFETQIAKNITAHSNYGKYRLGNIGDFKNTGTGDKIDIRTAGNLNLNLRNANIDLLEAKNLEADFHFTDLTAQKMGDIEMSLRNSNLDIQEADDVKGRSEWGEIKLGGIKNFDNTGTGTVFKIQSAQSVKVIGNNAKLNIGKVVERLDANLTFGYCNTTLTSTSPQIHLVGKNADFDLKVPSQSQFALEIASNTKNFKYPSSIEKREEVERIGTYQLQGWMGQENVDNLVRAQLSFGSLILRTR